MAYRYRDQAYLKRMDNHIKALGGAIDMAKVKQEWQGRKSVSDLLPDPTKYGEYVRVREIEGAPVEIVGITDWSGLGDPSMSKGPTLLVNADREDGTKVWFLVSHIVLYRKLEALRERTPFLATFTMVDDKGYYDVQ